MRPTSRRALGRVTAIVAVAAAALTACSSAAKPTATTDRAAASAASNAGTDLSGVTLHVGDQVNISKTLLTAAGQDKNLPYKIEWSSFAAGPPLLEAINAGAVDVGGVGDAPPIFAQASGAAIKVVAASVAADPKQSALAIVVPKTSTVRTVADLKGKKIGVAQGSAAHWLLLAALDKAGLSFTDVRPAYLLPSDGLAAFNGGDIDAWAVWDPFVSMAEAQGGRIVTTGAGLTGGFGFQVARPAALADPKVSAAIGDYLHRLSAATAWAVDHKADWGAQYAQLTKLSPEIVAKTFDRFQSKYAPIDDQLIKQQQAEADAFTRAGLIPKSIRVADVFDTRYAVEFKGA